MYVFTIPVWKHQLTIHKFHSGNSFVQAKNNNIEFLNCDKNIFTIKT